MKKITLIILIALSAGMFQQATAQISAGAGLVYATNIGSLGINLNAAYQIDDDWAATGAFTYFLESDYVKWSALDFNANYNITEFDNIGLLYGLGGINMTFVKIDIPGYNEWMGDVSTTSAFVGLNLGVGLKIELSEQLYIAPEIAFTIINGSYLRFGAKCMYNF